MQRPLRFCGLWLILVLCTPAIAQTPILLVAPDGGAVDWSEWLAGGPPSAAVLWASWSPQADEVVNQLDRLGTACRAKGLRLLLVDTQEPLSEARPTLDELEIPWLHDRHGALLKHYRVTRIPALVIVDEHATLLVKLPATAQAVTEWQAQ